MHVTVLVTSRSPPSLLGGSSSPSVSFYFRRLQTFIRTMVFAAFRQLNRIATTAPINSALPKSSFSSFPKYHAHMALKAPGSVMTPYLRGSTSKVLAAGMTTVGVHAHSTLQQSFCRQPSHQKAANVAPICRRISGAIHHDPNRRWSSHGERQGIVIRSSSWDHSACNAPLMCCRR